MYPPVVTWLLCKWSCTLIRVKYVVLWRMQCLVLVSAITLAQHNVCYSFFQGVNPLPPMAHDTTEAIVAYRCWQQCWPKATFLAVLQHSYAVYPLLYTGLSCYRCCYSTSCTCVLHLRWFCCFFWRCQPGVLPPILHPRASWQNLYFFAGTDRLLCCYFYITTLPPPSCSAIALLDICYWTATSTLQLRYYFTWTNSDIDPCYLFAACKPSHNETRILLAASWARGVCNVWHWLVGTYGREFGRSNIYTFW